MKVKDVARPHLDSFNYAMTQGLFSLCERMQPLEIEMQAEADFRVCKIWIESLRFGSPLKPAPAEGAMRDSRLLPSECRLRALTYAAPLVAEIARQIDGSIVERFEVNFGNVPIMVRSKLCHLSSMSEAEAIKSGEDFHDPGGYFIVNGIERLVRLLIVNKRNYPIAINRPAFCNRGPLFTPLAVQVRCVRDDLFAQTVTVHYLSDGSASVRFLIRRSEFMIPAIVLLKCLKGFTDYELYSRLVKGNFEDRLISNRVEVLIRDSRRFAVFSQEQALAFLGSKFRATLSIPAYLTDKQAGEQLIKEHLFVQLEDFADKFFYLVFLIEKLYALAAGEVQPENLDALCCHDLLLPGQLYLNLVKERIEDTLDIFKARVLKEKDTLKLRDKVYVARILESISNIGAKLQFFLATGNITSKTGLDLSQVSGFTVVAEKINYARYISHFQSVHRGQYFTEMKITTVRKLLPESWGFMCPVHTPDGSPCGLLNHLARSCEIVGEETPFEFNKLVRECVEFGMEALSRSDFCLIYRAEHVVVVLDGRVIGYTADPEQLVAGLRSLKGTSLPETAEIACFLDKPLFPAIYVFTSFGRLVRPVKNLATGLTEYIGPLEQTNLSIAVLDVDIRADTTHQEISALNILSVLAVTTPFSDYNQSPRNMYQCQMAKQTMGTPLFNYRFRTDTKSYRLLTPQRPLVNSEVGDMDEYGFKDYPSGTNAVVAVISYTGYDMEDAMILNKSAYERGFAHGCVYKTMSKKFNEKDVQHAFIEKTYASKATELGLDTDGLAFVGQELKNADAELLMQDVVKEDTKTYTYRESENAIIEEVRVFSADRNGQEFSVHYTYRHPRNPIIGDKFSSRHGQKGVLSILWPTEDMPFTESGLTPDIIINPHAFPTRMTIGMLIESMAGKSGALMGSFQDSTPFQQYYDDSVVQYFGEELQKAGYNYYGNELMYSGIFGAPLKADIFIGVVYYQRLRHMVADKFQARSTGPIDVLTHQPVKGRKHHGGIRLGEMERDSLLAHGTAFLLYDRLMKCSDYSEGYVCPQCHSLLTVIRLREEPEGHCIVCGTPGVKTAVPFVLRYLTNELAAMNIKLMFAVKCC